MTPIDFKQANAQLLEDETHCGTIPVMKTADGGLISCWELSEHDKQTIAESGRFFLIHDVTKGFKPVMPVSDIEAYILDDEQPLNGE